jgi:hypothetical protein
MMVMKIHSLLLLNKFLAVIAIEWLIILVLQINELLLAASLYYHL